MSQINSGYQHSEAFSKLKGTKESIDTNLTSAQYLKTIDAFLKNAILVIVKSSHYFDDYLVRLLGWQEAHVKRKVSFVSRQEFAAATVNYLIQPTKELKSGKIDDLRLERGVIFELCRSYLTALADYEKACNHTLHEDPCKELAYKRQVEQFFQSEEPLMASISLVRYWTSMALDYKHKVLEKYTRMCLNQAQKDYVSYFNMSIPLDDIVQAYILVAGRALDKCDYRQGVLTSHIQTWFYTARSALSEDIGSKTVNDTEEATESEDLDTLSDMMDRESNILKVRKLARLVDHSGLGRFFLGIEETLEPIQTYGG